MEQRIPLKRAEWIGLTGLILQLVFAGLTFLIHQWNRSPATFFEGWHFLAGAGIWLLAYLQLSARRRAYDEKFEEKAVSENTETLFTGDTEDPLSATVQLSRLEQWVIPVATFILSGLFIFAGINLFIRYLRMGRPPSIDNASITTAFMTGFSFFSYLFSKYTLGMAAFRPWRILRAGGSYLFSNALISFLTAISLALIEVPIRAAEDYVAALIPLLLGILGVELFLNLILDLYRPRIKGQESRPPYDSRIFELLTGSSSLIKAAAHTLDYQFGFKVSQTWFWRFMEKAIAPLILFQLVSLYLINTFIIIEPHEQAILERFGKAHALLEPGFHMKWPWPVDAVYRYPVKKVHILNLGAVKEADEDGEEESDKHKAILYTQAHAHEEYLLLVGQKNSDEERIKGRIIPVNFLVVSLFIHYRINDLYQYLYNHEEPDKILEGIAYREIIQLAASVDIMDIMGAGKSKVESILKEKIQNRCVDNHIGIEIIAMGIKHAHPPVQVADAFEAVISAMEEENTLKLKAHTQGQSTLIKADIERNNIITKAGIYKTEKENMIDGELSEFNQIKKAYDIGGNLYLIRKYFSLIENRLSKARIYVMNVVHKGKEVTILNMEDRLPDITDLDFSYRPEEKKK